MLERFQKPPFLCVHIDSERFQKPPFLWISTFDSVFENVDFCGVFVQINVNTFKKTDFFLSVFAQKRCSVNGALKNVYLSESKLNYQERNWSLKNKQ